ncbi:MAG: hypothetical protein DWQ35_01545, partial [Planctomycetota bacterium]
MFFAKRQTCLRFRLRSLFALLTAAAILFAYLGPRIRQSQLEKPVVDWIVKRGGSVRSKGRGLDRYFGERVIKVYLNSADVTDISKLASLRHLVYVDLDNTMVTDLRPLAHLP